MANELSVRKGFSALRAIVIGAVLLIVGSFWIIIQELLLNAGSLSSSSPPVGAVGLFAAALSVVLLLQWVRIRWGLGRKELLLIYCMLITFFPLASEGLWHRFVGIILSVRTNESYAVEIPDRMIPRGPEMIRNNEFKEGLDYWNGQAKVHTYQHKDTIRPAVLLANDNDEDICNLIQRIPRKDENGNDRFAPGQKFALCTYTKRWGFVSGSWFSLSMSVDGKRWRYGGNMGRDSAADTVDGTGLEVSPQYAFKIPHGVKDDLWLRWQLSGKGRVAIVKTTFHSNEPIHRLIEGSGEVSARYEALVPRDDRGRLLYRPEGLWKRTLYYLKGYIPWGAWLGPLLSWGLLWVAMFLAMYALAAILFRQWSDHEKLTFPLTVFPLLLTEPAQNGRRYIPRILRSQALWAGVITAVIVYSINGLHFYNADFPGLPLFVDLGKFITKAPWTALLGDGKGFALRVVLLGVGVSFFMDLQMSFNLWFFFLLCKLYMLIPFYQGKLPIRLWHGGPVYGHALSQFQGIGAAVGVVICVLWLGRRHIWGVLRVTIGRGGSDSDDSQEPMPYRLAMGTLLASVVLFGVWGQIAGAGWLFGVLGMGVMLVFAIMASRVRAECATPGMWLVPAVPLTLMIAMGGLLTFGVAPMSYVLLAGNFMCVGFFLMIMPALMESFQIAKVAGIHRRAVGWAMAIGFVVAIASGGYLLLNWGYARGLSTMRGRVTMEDDYASVLWQWRAEKDPNYNRLLARFMLESKDKAGQELNDDEAKQLSKLKELPRVHPSVSIAGIGAAITCLLAYLRLTFLRFPLHPLGYALATTQLMHYFWFSIFLGWVIRLAGLRLGGVRAIRNRFQPYMIGLILGSVVAVLLWDAVAIYRVAYGYTGQVYITW